MKTVIFSGAAALGLLTQWPLLFAADIANQTQPFSAASPVAIHALEN